MPMLENPGASTQDAAMDNAFAEALSEATQARDTEQAETPEEPEAPAPAAVTETAPAAPAAATTEAPVVSADVDPRTLPPELQSIYKKMQAGFTKRMQEVSQTAKQAEAAIAFQKDWSRFSEFTAQDPARAIRLQKWIEAEAGVGGKPAAPSPAASADADYEEFLKKYDLESQGDLRQMRELMKQSILRELSPELQRVNQELQKAGGSVQKLEQAIIQKEAAAESSSFEAQYPDWQERLTPQMQDYFKFRLQTEFDKPVSEVYESIIQELNVNARASTEKATQQIVKRAGQKVLTPSGSNAASTGPKYTAMEDAFADSMREHGHKM